MYYSDNAVVACFMVQFIYPSIPFSVTHKCSPHTEYSQCNGENLYSTCEEVLQVVIHMEEEQDLGMVNEMSRDHLGSDQGTTTTDDHSVHLSVYLAYLSLGFKVISTVIIVATNGWLGYYHN